MSVPTGKLSEAEREILLRIARQALEQAILGKSKAEVDFSSASDIIFENGATFVTLTLHGELRGCIGALEAYQPLIEDVREHVVAAAMNDYRFTPVQAEELNDINIEISRLTAPTPLDYSSPLELPGKLRIGVDGVILRDGWKRATFLPQVWEKLPEPTEFLDHLCLKMGGSPNMWRQKKMEVLVYEVEEFHE